MALDPCGSRCKVDLQALCLMHDDGRLTRDDFFLAIAESGMSSSLSLISPLDQPLQSLGPALGGPPPPPSLWPPSWGYLNSPAWSRAVVGPPPKEGARGGWRISSYGDVPPAALGQHACCEPSSIRRVSRHALAVGGLAISALPAPPAAKQGASHEALRSVSRRLSLY